MGGGRKRQNRSSRRFGKGVLSGETRVLLHEGLPNKMQEETNGVIARGPQQAFNAQRGPFLCRVLPGKHPWMHECLAFYNLLDLPPAKFKYMFAFVIVLGKTGHRRMEPLVLRPAG